MRISFILPKHNYIAKSFCNLMVHWIRETIKRTTNMQLLQIKIDEMVESKLINWVGEEEAISAKRLLQVIVRSIEWHRFRNEYTIQINPNILFPNSYTSVEKITRYINYGTLTSKGTGFISVVFDKYQRNVYKYFLMYKLKIKR